MIVERSVVDDKSKNGVLLMMMGGDVENKEVVGEEDDNAIPDLLG